MWWWWWVVVVVVGCCCCCRRCRRRRCCCCRCCLLSSSLMLLLNSGHCRLLSHMYRLRLSHTNECPCGTGVQVPEHIRQNCRPTHTPERTRLLDNLGLTSRTSCGDTTRRNFKPPPSSSATSTSQFDMTIPTVQRRRRIVFVCVCMDDDDVSIRQIVLLRRVHGMQCGRRVGPPSTPTPSLPSLYPHPLPLPPVYRRAGAVSRTGREEIPHCPWGGQTVRQSMPCRIVRVEDRP